MKNYRGVVVIQCNKNKCTEKEKKTIVDHNCMNCQNRIAEIVDLKNETIFVFNKVAKKKQVKKEI